MITYDKNSIVEMAVRSIGMPCVYIDNNMEFDTVEQQDAWESVCNHVAQKYSSGEFRTANYVNVISTIMHGGLIAFDTESEQKEFYSIFMQDKLHEKGIYAVAFDKDGNAMDENT